MDQKHAHLEMIQGVINRLSQNSFLLKGWSVITLSSLLALAGLNSDPVFLYVALIPLLSFWGLDAYFLRQERLFRSLYDEVREQDVGQIDYSMNTSPFTGTVGAYWKIAASRTLLVFHGTLFVTILLIGGILLLQGQPNENRPADTHVIE